MKTKIQILLTSFLTMICTNAIGYEYCSVTTCPTNEAGFDTYSAKNCSGGASKTCYRGTGSGTTRIVYSCSSCPNNLTKTSYNVTECNGLTYSTCGCDAGYYVDSSKCVKCPEPGTSYSNTTGGITNCYIPKGNYSDSTGKYALNNNCYYHDNASSSSSSA